MQQLGSLLRDRRAGAARLNPANVANLKELGYGG